MTAQQTTIAASVALLAVLLGFGIWLIALSNPSPELVAAKEQPPQPLPSLSVDQLQQQAGSRQIFGALPIDLNLAALGRLDPFANR